MVRIPALQRLTLARQTFDKRQIRRAGIESAYRCGKAVLKIEPAVLAVGHYGQADLLLQGHGVPDFLIFDPAQLFYAAARGLDPAAARALLLEGFIAGLWDDVADEVQRADIAAAARSALRAIA